MSKFILFITLLLCRINIIDKSHDEIAATSWQPSCDSRN